MKSGQCSDPSAETKEEEEECDVEEEGVIAVTEPLWGGGITTTGPQRKLLFGVGDETVRPGHGDAGAL